jgi:hypothetical protein
LWQHNYLTLYDLGGLLFLLYPVKSENQRLLNF